MKDRLINYLSFVVLLCYIAGIVGLSVHSCPSTGQSFVNPCLYSYTCSELHPGHSCQTGHCALCDQCDNTHSVSSCCTTDTYQLSITGERGDKSGLSCPDVPQATCLAYQLQNLNLEPVESGCIIRPGICFLHKPDLDYSSRYCIWII